MVQLHRTALVIVSYLPQIMHLVREGCSAGISFRAYAMWMVAAVLRLAYASLARAPVLMGAAVLPGAGDGPDLLLLEALPAQPLRAAWRSDSAEGA